MITVNSRKFDGSIRRSWACEIIEQDDELIVAVGKFDSDVNHPDLGLITRGTLSEEYFWLDRWYNIFRFITADGVFRNYYCNICMPPRLTDNELDYVDLDLDVVVETDFSYRILDRDDFEANANLYNYPVEIRERAEVALQELLELIKSGNFPDLFATTRANLRESG